jgi:hypothetical protein
MTKDLIVDYFLKCFSSVTFAVIRGHQVPAVRKELIVKDSISYLKKMILTAKKDLSKVTKAHRAGKLSMEDVIDHEHYLAELTEQLRKIIEIDNSDELI